MRRSSGVASGRLAIHSVPSICAATSLVGFRLKFCWGLPARCRADTPTPSIGAPSAPLPVPEITPVEPPPCRAVPVSWDTTSVVRKTSDTANSSLGFDTAVLPFTFLLRFQVCNQIVKLRRRQAVLPSGHPVAALEDVVAGLRP